MWLKPSWLSAESYGLILVLLSAILYAIAGAFVKLTHEEGGLPSTEIVMARGIFQGSLVVWGLYVSRDEKQQRLIYKPFGAGAARKIVWIRGILGGAGFLFDYHCMAVLPLGDAITLMSLYPFLTIFLARLFLQEEIKPLHLVVTVASVVGAVFIAQPTFVFGRDPNAPPAPTIGYFTGIAGSCCLAVVVTAIRKAGKMGVHTFQLLLSWALFGVLFAFVIGPYEGKWKLPETRQVSWYLAGVCLVGAGTHFMLNYAGRLAPAGLVSVVRSSDIVWAYAIEIKSFGQHPNGYTWLGVVLVLGSLIGVAYEKTTAARADRKAEQERLLKEKQLDNPVRNVFESGMNRSTLPPALLPVVDEEEGKLA